MAPPFFPGLRLVMPSAGTVRTSGHHERSASVAGAPDKTPFVPVWAALLGSAWPAERAVGEGSKAEPGEIFLIAQGLIRPGGRRLGLSEPQGAGCVCSSTLTLPPPLLNAQY